MQVDFTRGEQSIPQPGVYLAEIIKAEEKYAKSGDPMFMVTFKDTETHKELVRDVIMLDGNGARIGYAKLEGLGFSKSVTNIDPMDMIGKRVKIALGHRDYKGPAQATVDIQAPESFCGYWPEGEGPEVTKPENVPF